MPTLFKIMLTLALCGAGVHATASPEAPVNGTDYQTLPEAQNTDAGKKVEVTEFFAYYCPHCASFEPALAEWVKKQGDKIVFKRVHLGHTPAVVPQQRLYYTLESMGLAPQYHARVFSAMHEQHQRFANDEQVFDWAASAGIDRAKFTDAYRSFGVQAKLARANSMVASYQVKEWPQVAIAGKYVTSPNLAGSSATVATEAQQQQMALQVMDHLVAKAAAEKK
ncbi:thiol:disulfide interchange protein DsbA/DsbL [Massilia antarctica]|uniref:thiol:disulfide interchange protein DsbA/DsbL n=1 Tax=Massilia antarctica TaxID=2765360 RepID=UPI0006BB581F|nr:thiol:disulfide interchange protein DsbA/DsbL [Massilia sp. H27-R4]MCY0915899.1 thiol:disulfide interchange protein DsbA/DsbL [Massilia sp. H27-R4]CUI07317.1 Periplasmic thiol:disulfide interchange protein DsbA [Janthinobacterium sp. CG23_2]CUU31103.1 Periplasmic thiol:disulfide interchange protein DsbA [Janthinobacterium sp. CG23_2]